MLGAARAGLLSSVAFVKQSYAETVSALNPVSYWQLGELGGTTIVDQKAVQNGTYRGTTQGTVEYGLEPLVQNSVGASLAFDGTHTYGQIAHHPAFATSNGTIVLAAQPDSVTGQHLLLAKDQSGMAGGFTVDVNNGRLRAYLRNSAGSAQWLPDPNGAANIEAGTAYHVAFTWGSRGTELWLNGELVASNPELTTGLGANNRDLFIGAYPGPVAFGDAVFDEIAFFGQQLSAQQIDRLAQPRSIARGVGGAVGIQVPQFAYQEITDSVPAGAVWWDPTNGNDGSTGASKAQAKRTFAAAEALATTSKRIILAGGSEGSTTYHIVGKIIPTKSGTGSGARMELFAEPNRKVVLVREGDFLGGINGAWTWTQVSASLNTWDSPNLGIGDGATTVNSGNPAMGSNWLAGFIRIPNGCNDRPHLMKLPWVGTTEMNNTGGGNPDEGGYAGPSVCFLGNGRIRIRLQPPTQAMAGNEWPTDGIMGGLIGPNGTWVEPSGTPNDYEIHLVRWDGDFADNGNKDLFDFAANNVNWWHVKGVNSALINRTMKVGANTGIKFEKCTSYPHWCGVGRHSTSNSSVELIRCRHLTGDNRSMSWRAHKTAGYWFQHYRSAHLFDSVNVGSASTLTMSHCTLFGWFDEGLPSRNGGTITVDHCAILNSVDDAFQCHTDGSLQIIRTYSYVFGGPFRSTDGDNSDGSTVHWIEHHNVYHQPGIPLLWKPYGSNQSGVTGICPNMMYTLHSSKGKATKSMYNTIVVCADCGKSLGRGPMMSTSDAGTNVPPGAAHEVFNNLICLIATKRYPTPDSTGDSMTRGISCHASSAGIHRYDYNLWFRSLPGSSSSPFFLDVQNSRGVNRANYTSLANFRASAHRTTSHSMYSDGTQGHEEHGVQENPLFRDLADRDFRPQSSGATSGAKNVTSIIGGSFENWKGALNPSGNGSEVGPQDP